MVWNETCDKEEGGCSFILQQSHIKLYVAPEIAKVPEDTEIYFFWGRKSKVLMYGTQDAQFLKHQKTLIS